MRLLVTGKQGQIALSLAERARSFADIDLIFAGRPEVDLQHQGAIREAIREVRPDLVINAAAFTDVDAAEDAPDLAFRINAEGAGEAAEAAHMIGVPIVQISTDYLFDGLSDAPYREDELACPVNVYGRSKLAGEEAVRAANPNHLILRTAWIYSPFGRNFVKTIFNLGDENRPISIAGDQLGNPTSALDFADLLLKIAPQMRCGIGATYHLAGSGMASRYELASHVMTIRQALGLPIANLVVGTPAQVNRPPNSTLDCSRFAHDFGLNLPAWRNSVVAVVRRLAGKG